MAKEFIVKLIPDEAPQDPKQNQSEVTSGDVTNPAIASSTQPNEQRQEVDTSASSQAFLNAGKAVALASLSSVAKTRAGNIGLETGDYQEQKRAQRRSNIARTGVTIATLAVFSNPVTAGIYAGVVIATAGVNAIIENNQIMLTASIKNTESTYYDNLYNGNNISGSRSRGELR